MATDGKATWWNATSGAPAYLAQELRQIDALEVMPGPASEPFSGRPGRRVNNSGLVVSVSSTGDGSVSVSAGVCLLYSSAQAVQGVWRAQFPAIGPIALGARPASGFSRIVLVLARLYDSDSSIGSVKEAKIELLAGSNSSGTPVAPTTPASWVALELDRLTVTSSGTITHVQTTQRTVAAGGVLPVATTAEMDKLKTDNIAYPGMVINNEQTDAIYRYNGTAWKLVQDEKRFGSIPAPTVSAADAPGDNDPILVQGPIPVTATTSAAGLVVVAWPLPFPNGILSAPPQTISGAGQDPVINAGTLSKTGATYVFPGLANAAVKFVYEAKGW